MDMTRAQRFPDSQLIQSVKFLICLILDHLYAQRPIVADANGSLNKNFVYDHLITDGGGDC